MESEADIIFEGRDDEPLEPFLRAFKKHAFALGKQRDNDWLADFASVCFDGEALRWFESLDEEVRTDWRVLRPALLERYPPLGSHNSRAHTVPIPAPAAMVSTTVAPIEAILPATPSSISLFDSRVGKIRVVMHTAAPLGGSQLAYISKFPADRGCTGRLCLTRHTGEALIVAYNSASRRLVPENLSPETLANALGLTQHKWVDVPLYGLASITETSGKLKTSIVLDNLGSFLPNWRMAPNGELEAAKPGERLAMQPMATTNAYHIAFVTNFDIWVKKNPSWFRIQLYYEPMA